MALARWNGVVQDAAGNAVSGASIEVRDEATGFLAPLFSDRDGTVGLGNPYVAEGPEIAFHARGGNYRIKATKGAEQKTWRWVAIGTSQALDADQIATYLQAGIVPVQNRTELDDYAPAIPAPGEPETPLGGVVYADPDPALNGYYTYNFTTTEWDFARPLSDTLAGLSVVSVDDNEISAAASPGVNPAGVKAFYLDLDDWENTGPVTIRIDGAAAIPVVDVTGGEFLPGFATGRLFLSNEGSSLRMIVGGDYMAAVTAAIDAAIRAEAAAASLNLPVIQPGDERKQLYVKPDLSGYELDKPARGGGELFKTVADMLADDNVVIGYEGSGASIEVAPGDIVTAQGFRYEVAASGAADGHVETAGGVKLYASGQEVWIEQLGARAGDNTFDNTAIINKAIRLPGKTVRAGTGSFRCAGPVTWPNEYTPTCPIFKGSGKWQTVFDFSSVPDGTVCLGLGSAGANLSFRTLSDFKILGRKAAIGAGTIGIRFNMGGTGVDTVNRISLSEIEVQNHSIGIEGIYSWYNILTNVEIRGCTLGTRALTQCNAWEWASPIFGNCDQFVSLRGSDSWLMTNPGFQNINLDSAFTSAILLGGSALTVVSPYYEYMREDILGVSIGVSSDAKPSTFISTGGYGDVTVGYRAGQYQLDHVIQVEGLNLPFASDSEPTILPQENIGYYGVLPSSARLSWVGVTPRAREQPIASFGKSASGFGNGVAGATTQFYTPISRASGTFFHAIDGLEVGQVYTIAALMQTQTASANAYLVQVVSGSNVSVEMLLLHQPNENLRLKYLPFRAKAAQAQIRLPINVNINFYMLRVYKGCVFPQIDPFYVG